MTLTASEWVTLGLSSLGAIWIALIFTDIFSVILRWIIAKLETIKAPDFVPEEWY